MSAQTPKKAARAKRTASPAPQAHAHTARTYAVSDLAKLTGVTVRNIRAYQTAGLLEPPILQGRLALYDKQHLGRLELIRELRSLGFGLDAIADMLAKVPRSAASPYALIAQMFSRGFFQTEQPERKSMTELTGHWREKASQEQVLALIRNGLYKTAQGAEALNEQTQVDVLSPSLWAIGKQMADLNIPLSTVLDMQEKLIAHCRSLAQAYVDQFVIAMVREVTQSGNATVEALEEVDVPLTPKLLRTIHKLIEQLRPIAIGSVSAAFPVVLQQEFDRDVVERIQRLVQQLRENQGTLDQGLASANKKAAKTRGPGGFF
jgi:DNA-binding transcriptional MerR regulator